MRPDVAFKKISDGIPLKGGGDQKTLRPGSLPVVRFPLRLDQLLGGRPAAAGDGETYVKTYGVADLVVPMSPPNDPKAVEQINMNPLKELIFATVAPGTWQVVGSGVNQAPVDPNAPGPVGSIIPFNLSVSLIVRHTPEVHAQVAERLEMLRHLIKVRETNGERMRQLGLPDPKAAPDGSGMTGMMAAMMGAAGGSAPAPVNPSAAGPPGMMSSMMGMASQPSTPGNETERRLRAVEEKLDRLLKVLEKSGASDGEGTRRE